MARTKQVSRARPYGGAPVSSHLSTIQPRSYAGASGSSQTPTTQTEPGTNNRRTHLDWDGIDDAPNNAWADILAFSYKIFQGPNQDSYLIRYQNLREVGRRKFETEYWDYMFGLCYALQHIIVRIKNMVFHKTRLCQRKPIPQMIENIMQGMMNIAWFRWSALNQVWNCLKGTQFDRRPLYEAYNRYGFELELPNETELEVFLDQWNPPMDGASWTLGSDDLAPEAYNRVKNCHPWGLSDSSNEPTETPCGKDVASQLRASVLKVYPRWGKVWNDDKFDKEIDFPSVIIGNAAQGDNMNGPGPSNDDPNAHGDNDAAQGNMNGPGPSNADPNAHGDNDAHGDQQAVQAIPAAELQNALDKLGPLEESLKQQFPTWMNRSVTIENESGTVAFGAHLWHDSEELPDTLRKKGDFRDKVDQLISLAQSPGIGRDAFTMITWTITRLRLLAGQWLRGSQSSEGPQSSQDTSIAIDEIDYLDDQMKGAFQS